MTPEQQATMLAMLSRQANGGAQGAPLASPRAMMAKSALQRLLIPGNLKKIAPPLLCYIVYSYFCEGINLVTLPIAITYSLVSGALSLLLGAIETVAPLGVLACIGSFYPPTKAWAQNYISARKQGGMAQQLMGAATLTLLYVGTAAVVSFPFSWTRTLAGGIDQTIRSVPTTLRLTTDNAEASAQLTTVLTQLPAFILFTAAFVMLREHGAMLSVKKPISATHKAVGNPGSMFKPIAPSRKANVIPSAPPYPDAPLPYTTRSTGKQSPAPLYKGLPIGRKPGNIF